MRSEFYDDTRVHASCVRCGSPFLRQRGETWKRQCAVCWQSQRATDAFLRGFEAGRAEALRDAPGAIPPERLRALLQLVHPDRHGGSALATNTTAWLLTQRRVGVEVA